MWEDARDEAIENIDKKSKVTIFASDIDPNAIELSKINAKRAGVDKYIRFEVCDFKDAKIFKDKADKIVMAITTVISFVLVLVISVGVLPFAGATYTERDKIIDIDTCVEATHIINPLLDECDLLDDSYILDVTTKEKGGDYE